MPVVPPSMQLMKGPMAAYRFCFNPGSDVVTRNILGDKANTDVDETRYYVPSSTIHEGLESMCVAEDKTDKKKTLCLFQSKNNDLEDAIAGLNSAAKELRHRNIWKGEFLFVIFALDSTGQTQTTADHPTLLTSLDLSSLSNVTNIAQKAKAEKKKGAASKKAAAKKAGAAKKAAARFSRKN